MKSIEYCSESVVSTAKNRFFKLLLYLNIISSFMLSTLFLTKVHIFFAQTHNFLLFLLTLKRFFKQIFIF